MKQGRLISTVSEKLYQTTIYYKSLAQTLLQRVNGGKTKACNRLTNNSRRIRKYKIPKVF